jgi:hypothetical protein
VTVSRIPQRVFLVRLLRLVEGPGLIFNHSCDIAGSSIRHNGNVFLVLPDDYPPGGGYPVIPPDPTQYDSPKEGRVGRLVRDAREMFKAITRKRRGLLQAGLAPAGRTGAEDIW